MHSDTASAPPAPSVPSARIFDIQRFSTHDGPGIRTTVFFKGCPLRCKWCSNPESQQAHRQVLYFEGLCKACSACRSVCEHGAIQPAEQDGETGRQAMRFDRTACTACGACIPACPHSARTLSGREIGLEELCAILRQDWRYYRQSGGGITCGGGEALAQHVFVRALLAACHDEFGYHTCLDTCGYAPGEALASVLPFLDLVLFDIKHMNDAEHRRMTGRGNKRILSNARLLAERRAVGGPDVLIRVPLIPAFNDTREHMLALAAFMRECGFKRIELMPYHSFGLGKYRALGLEYAPGCSGPPDAAACVALLEQSNVEVLVHQ